jgi:hypothetical protein
VVCRKLIGSHILASSLKYGSLSGVAAKLQICHPYKSVWKTEILQAVMTEILDVFPKSRKATVSFVMSVCPSIRTFIRMYQLGSHRADFHVT